MILAFCQCFERLAVLRAWNAGEKVGMHTHDDGDDRQWKLSRHVSMAGTLGLGGEASSSADTLPVSSRSASREWWEHLRKTALGASSPAKPALHIPELGGC